MCTASSCLESNISHKIASPEGVVRSNCIIGTSEEVASWSTLKTANPDCAAARESDPLPAKSSIKSGTPELIGGESGSPKIQSVWLHR